MNSINRQSSFKRVRIVLAIALLQIPFFVLTACAAKQDVIGDRFLYVVSCEGNVDKLDTVTGKRVQSLDLVQRSGAPTVPPTTAAAPSSTGLPGICWARRVLQDVNAKLVYVVAPTAQRANSQDAYDFRLLTFSLPEWKLTNDSPAGSSLPDAPFISRDAKGAIALQTDAHQQSDLAFKEFNDYEGRGKFFINGIIETSGDVRLLSMHADTPDRLVLGVANTRTRTLKTLTELPSTTDAHAHLAPGGEFVVVELTKPKSDPVSRTGALRLYSAGGEVIKNVSDESVSTMDFLALTPNGSAIYSGRGEYRFVPFGLRFVPLATQARSLTVASPLALQGAQPGLVFFDQ